MPDEIRQMRKLAESFSFYRQSAEKRFYDQAVMMAAYEDDFAYTGQFVRYFPTYETMDTRQLRGYFTWRTNVRRGDVQPCPLSFVYVYVYELLNRVCGESPEEGYEKLRAFWQTYRVFEPGLDRYLRVWLRDYVVYYGLDKSLLHGLTDTEYDDALLALQNGSEAERFDALVRLSAYRTENSRFFKENPDDVRAVACRAYDALSAYCEAHRKKSLFERCFGQICACAYHPFESAVFYDQKRYEDYTYELNPVHRYRCVHGQWTCEKYHGTRGRSKELGELLRAVDALMREKYGFKHPLSPAETPKIVLSVLGKEIDAFLAEKQQRERPRIELDLSKLRGIRQAAAVTREKLMTESEREPEPEAEAPPAPAAQQAPSGGGVAAERGRARVPRLPAARRRLESRSGADDALAAGRRDQRKAVRPVRRHCSGVRRRHARAGRGLYRRIERNRLTNMKIPKRIASTVINSLKGGVVPRVGLPYITVGREAEIGALLHDIDIIAEGGASFRFIVGKYGSGKSFLLQTIRNYVMDKGFVVVDADLSPERRLQGTKGQGLATYKELIRNMSTKTRPEGGALTLVLDRWLSGVQSEAADESGLSPDDPALAKLTERKIREVIGALSEMVHGFDFSKLLTIYYRAYTRRRR